MGKNTKTISLSKLKIAEAEVADGQTERRVTFVASTATEDRDREQVLIEGFRLPLKGGGEILVKDLPADGADNVDIPLLTNHDIWDVEKTIGSVRRAMFTDGKLIFEAGISSRPYAQDVFKLIEEGHLDNAFSIQFDDYDYDSGNRTNSNGEIVEVSLVTRGSNKDAQVLAVKQAKEVKGKGMDNEDPKTPSEEAQPTQTPEDTQVEPTEAKGKPAGEVAGNTKDEENQEDNTTETVEEEEDMSTELNHKEMAAKQIRKPGDTEPRPSQKAMSNYSAGTGYLKSKQCENDFAKHIHDNFGKSGSAVMKSWAEKMREKGISGDEILPERLENIFFKAWNDLTSPLSTFRRLKNLRGSLNAWTTEDTAKRHKKGGKDKTSQNVSNKRRDYKAVMIYKLLEVDLEDLIFDDGGEIVLLRNEELTERINGLIVKAAIVGDGKAENDDDALFDGNRGIYSIKGDLDAAGTANSYASLVATVLDSTTTPATNIYEKIIRTIGAVKREEGEVVVFVPEGTLTDLALTKNSQGDYVFPAGTDFEKTLKARIFEADYIEGSGYDVIAYRAGKYALPLGDMMTHTGFDMKTNKQGMLQERMVAGSLFGSKVAAGYATATANRSAKSAKKPAADAGTDETANDEDTK